MGRATPPTGTVVEAAVRLDSQVLRSIPTRMAEQAAVFVAVKAEAAAAAGVMVRLLLLVAQVGSPAVVVEVGAVGRTPPQVVQVEGAATGPCT